MSKVWTGTAARAAAGSAAAVTEWPASSSAIFSVFRMPGSSSTTSILSAMRSGSLRNRILLGYGSVLLLLTARRRDWPLWAMVPAWLPALVLLGGRMYIRPETLTLLWLAAFLAILFRWERYPRLAYLLPLIQFLWVNTQGLFILGPIVLAFALLDALLAPGAFGKGRRRWWRTARGR